MNKDYYPFLVAASLYADYSPVVVPENVKPLVIAKITKRGDAVRKLYFREVESEDGVFEALYTYETVPMSLMYEDKSKEIPLVDRKGREIEMFYGVFGKNIPKDRRLIELAFDEVKPLLSKYLNETSNWRPMSLGKLNTNFALDNSTIDEIITLDSVKMVKSIYTNKTIAHSDIEGGRATMVTPPIRKDIVDETPKNGNSSSSKKKKHSNISLAKKAGGTSLIIGGVLISYTGGVLGVVGAISAGVGAYLVKKSDRKGA